MSQVRMRRLPIIVATISLALGGLAPSPAGAQSPASSAPPMPALPTPEKAALTIGLPAMDAISYAAKLAEQAGIWAKDGVTPTISVLDGDAKVIEALQAGQLDIGFVGTAAALNTQLTDTPVVVLGTNAGLLSDDLVTAPDITTADQLRGRCVAIATLGSLSHGSAMLALQSLGLTPADVAITEIGSQNDRIASLEGGACQAAVVDGSLRADMEAKGFHTLADLKALGVPWGRGDLVVTKDWLAANPETADVALAAVLEAQNLLWTQPDQAAALLATFRGTDPADAQKLIADFQTVGDRTLMWSDGAFENPRATLATVNPAMATLDITSAFDRSHLERLKTMGVYDALGIPVE